MNMLLREYFAFTALFLSAVFAFNCSNTNNYNDGDEIYDYNLECGSANNLDRYLEDLGLDNSIIIQFNNGSAPIIRNLYENEISIELIGENVIIGNLSLSSNIYNLVISGTTKNGSLKIYGNSEMGLYLNGVNITNPNGPAINIQNRQRNLVYLVDGTENHLADGLRYEYTSEDAKGTFFSEGQLYFFGCGSLEVKAIGKYAHAIVVDNGIEIENGKITIAESARDGIHANDEIYIRGGILSISSTGDAIQSEDSRVRISGGTIVAKSTGIKSHGISSTDSIIISGDANIRIEVSGNGSKGIKSDGFAAIRGGRTNIKTSGKSHIDNSINPPDTNTATGIKINNSMEISGGELAVQAFGADAKGINVEGDLTITNGDISIKANDDGIKVHGNLFVNDGNVCSWSMNKQNIDCNGVETINIVSVNNRSKCGGGF